MDEIIIVGDIIAESLNPESPDIIIKSGTKGELISYFSGMDGIGQVKIEDIMYLVPRHHFIKQYKLKQEGKVDETTMG